MSTILLSPFDESHTKALITLWRESFEHGVGVTDPHPIEEQLRYFQTAVLPVHTVCVATNGNELVGFVAANRESVGQLYVRVSHLRMGIGTMLLSWAKAQSAGTLWLYTFARNTHALAFYHKHGFREVARGFEPEWQLEDVKLEWTGDSNLR